MQYLLSTITTIPQLCAQSLEIPCILTLCLPVTHHKLPQPPSFHTPSGTGATCFDSISCRHSPEVDSLIINTMATSENARCHGLCGKSSKYKHRSHGAGERAPALSESTRRLLGAIRAGQGLFVHESLDDQ